MNISIRTTKDFDRAYRKLCKHYRSLPDDFRSFIHELETQAIEGKEVIEHVFKYRIAISSKGKGKAGGGRILTYEIMAVKEEKSITLTFIYDKSAQSSVSQKEIKELLKKAGL